MINLIKEEMNMGYVENFKDRYCVKSDVIALACWYEDNVFEPAEFGEEYVKLVDCDTQESVRIASHCVFNCMVLSLKQLKHTGTVSIIHNHIPDVEIDYRDYELDLKSGMVKCVEDNSRYTVPGERYIA